VIQDPLDLDQVFRVPDGEEEVAGGRQDVRDVIQGVVFVRGLVLRGDEQTCQSFTMQVASSLFLY
jgi:hypothetical protein